MADLNDRARSFENRFAQDADMRFRAEARRNRLMGLWAAGLLGKSGEEADTYAGTVVAADFEEAGHEDVVRKIAADLQGHATEADIRTKLSEMDVTAKAQLLDQNNAS